MVPNGNASIKNMTQEELERRLQESAGTDEVALDALIKSLSPDDIHQHRTALADAWYGIFSTWYFDFTCGKVDMQDPDRFFDFLMHTLDAAEKINPDVTYYIERGECYQSLSELKVSQEEKLLYIDKALQAYAAAGTERSAVALNSHLAEACLDRISILGQFTDAEFQGVLALHERALAAYSNIVLSTLLQNTFRVLQFPFAKYMFWHSTFMEHLIQGVQRLAEKDVIIFLDWSNGLLRILDHHAEFIPEAYRQTLLQRATDVLTPLTDYQTDNLGHLNYLGTAFSKAAERQPGSPTSRLPYYEVALKYFTKGQQLNPAAWTFPVYAGQTLMAMANIHDLQRDAAVISLLFETGNTIFANTYEHEKDFTLNLRWGEFLFEYARRVYNFDAPSILQQAASKLTLAKTLGGNYYSQPYLMLAKVALKSGDRAKCIALLKECRDAFTTEYYEYDLSGVWKDKDFAGIGPEDLA
jgi:hypothetical protein